MEEATTTRRDVYRDATKQYGAKFQMKHSASKIANAWPSGTLQKSLDSLEETEQALHTVVGFLSCSKIWVTIIMEGAV